MNSNTPRRSMVYNKIRVLFTLIELLVVISVIAILISILLPSLKKARDTGKRIKCSSNLKQMATVINMYMGDYEEWYPFYYGSNYVEHFYPYVNPSASWHTYQAKELLFWCDDARNSTETNYTYPRSAGVSYGYNIHFFWNEGSKVNWAPYPSSFMVMAESSLQKDDGTYDDKTGFMNRISPHIRNKNEGIISTRHNGRVPFLYADAHVDTRSSRPMHYGFDANMHPWAGSKFGNGNIKKCSKCPSGVMCSW